MHDENLLENLFDEKTLKIIRLFLDYKNKEFYLREIAKESDVPVSTTFRLVKKLVNANIIKQIKIKTLKLYKLAENDNTKYLSKLLKEKPRALEEFLQKAKRFDFIDEIILHGKEEKNKASVLLIGDNIDNGEIKMLCGKIKEDYNFNVLTVPLEREQFEQMSSMDLFPREKRLLYSREKKI
jgi:DNA-binding Lrp family transcriptional regulator